jgi:hypothetical protein
MRQVQTPVHHFCSRTERDRNILSQRTLRTAAENAETIDLTELSRERLGCAGWHQEIELDSACA